MADANQEAKKTTDQLAQFARQLQQVAVASQGVFASLKAGISAIQSQVVSFVEKANPAVVQKFKFAVEDLQGVIGRALTPLLINLTAVMQKLADYFYALSPAAKTVAAGLTAAAVGFTVISVALIGLQAVFSSLTGGLTAVLGGLTAGVLLASSSTDGLKAALDAMMGPLSQVLDTFGEIVTSIVYALMPAIETVFGLIAAGMRLLADAVQSVLPQLLRMVAWFRAIAEFVAQVLGIQIAAGAGPAKAPAAVRQAQIGGLSEFLNKQLVNALEKPGGKVDTITIGKGIAADVAKCKEWLEKIFGKPAAVQNVGQAVGNVAANGGLGGLGIMGIAAQIAARVVGK